MKQRASLRNEKLHTVNIYQDDWEEIYAIFLTRAKKLGNPTGAGIFADIIHDLLEYTRKDVAKFEEWVKKEALSVSKQNTAQEEK